VAIRIPTQADLLWVLDRAGTGRRPYLALVALCLVLWLPGFFTLPPGDRDESRFAQASKQMLETGDFVQIRNGLVARNQKPIGIYWLQVPFAAAARATGVAKANPIWPYRLPSLIGGLTAVLATYGFGRRLAGDRAALLGAAFLAASVILSVEVHVAKTDAVLLATTTVAMGLLSRAYLSPQSLGRGSALLFWAALGAGILVKGPILPMVAGLAILSLIALDWRRGKPRWLLALHPLPGIAVLLAIVLPWFIAIGLATHGTFFTQSVGGDLGGKLTGSDDAHGAPFGLHLLLLPLLGFAGGIAALACVPSVWQERRRPETRFLLAWILPAWLVFELVRTKLPHYTLPLYPAIALLAARWMCQPPAARSAWATVASSAAIAVALLLGIGAAALAEIADPGLHTVDLLGVPAALARLAGCAPRRASHALRHPGPVFYAFGRGTTAAVPAMDRASRRGGFADLLARRAPRGSRIRGAGFCRAEPDVPLRHPDPADGRPRPGGGISLWRRRPGVAGQQPRPAKADGHPQGPRPDAAERRDPLGLQLFPRPARLADAAERLQDEVKRHEHGDDDGDDAADREAGERAPEAPAVGQKRIGGHGRSTGARRRSVGHHGRPKTLTEAASSPPLGRTARGYTIWPMRRDTSPCRRKPGAAPRDKGYAPAPAPAPPDYPHRRRAAPAPPPGR
jgi:4-amino-4-deoxy-L-arabinose transferase-like glycosyltransferase